MASRAPDGDPGVLNASPFEVAIPGGSLRGHSGGTGPPALLLHGGAAVPDYLDGLADELAGLFTTYRYTQRGTRPSSGGPPFTIEAHMDDSLAVLDAFGIERAWVVGHSWGGHLALHLLTAHPDRLLGVVCVDPLPASPDVFVELDADVRSRLSADEIARLDELERRRRAGQITEDELIERFALVWPHYFVVPCALPRRRTSASRRRSAPIARSASTSSGGRWSTGSPPLASPCCSCTASRASCRCTRPRRPAHWCPAGG